MKTVRNQPTAFRFDPIVKASLALIAERDGHSMANMLEWLIRRQCEAEGLGWPPPGCDAMGVKRKPARREPGAERAGGRSNEQKGSGMLDDRTAEAGKDQVIQVGSESDKRANKAKAALIKGGAKADPASLLGESQAIWQGDTLDFPTRLPAEPTFDLVVPSPPYIGALAERLQPRCGAGIRLSGAVPSCGPAPRTAWRDGPGRSTACLARR